MSKRVPNTTPALLRLADIRRALYDTDDQTAAALKQERDKIVRRTYPWVSVLKLSRRTGLPLDEVLRTVHSRVKGV